MNGLIGNNLSAKFIFLACENEDKVPAKKELKEFFPNSQINIYKAWGHFHDSFWEIESLLGFRLNGKIENRWNNANRTITHAIRLDSACEKSIFFQLKYGEYIVAHLEFDHPALEKLGRFINGAIEAQSEIASIQKFPDRLEAVKHKLNQMGLHDPKIDSPCQNAVSTLIDNYGDEAKRRMRDMVNRWYDKHQWQEQVLL